MMMKIKEATLIVCLAWGGAWAAETPDPTDLLRRSLAPAQMPYSGRMTVTHWYSGHTRSDDINVWFRPPRSYRWEFLSPDGSVKRIVISDGTNEYTHLIANKKVLKGTAAKSVAKQLASDQEWMLLISNYGMALGEPEPVAGRPSWTIELAPVAPGKSHEKIWIDKQSGIILAIKRYHDHGETAIHSRYVQFKPGGTAPDSFFSTEMSDESESVDHGYNPAFSSDPGRLPRTLPLGFQFESADVFVSDGHRVEHFRFTDGLSQLSVFRADRPARFSNNAREESVSYTPGSIQAQDVGHVLNRKMDAGYFTLIGDVSDEGLARIADVLK